MDCLGQVEHQETHGQRMCQIWIVVIISRNPFTAQRGNVIASETRCLTEGLIDISAEERVILQSIQNR
jgi:hypothetical protein